MARKGNPKKMQATAQETKPVRVDLGRDIHKALRKEAADLEISMAALARKIIAEHLGFNYHGD